MTFVIPTLAFGGAERVMARLANHWAERGDDVTLITLDSAENDTYPLHPRVRRIGLSAMRESRNVFQAVWNNIGRIRALRRAIRTSRPERVVSFTDRMNVTTLFATRGLGVKVVVAERVDPRHHPIGRAWAKLRRWLYPRASAVVVQTEAVRTWMTDFVPPAKIHVIPNAVESSCESPIAGGQRPPDHAHHRVLAIGRLVPQKGFDLLIDAFSRIAERHPEWRLQILGRGPERDALLQSIRTHRLTDRVELHDWIADPATFLQQSDLFVLSSRYEGFPNALLEAMACGLPVVSFDCESGPDEIVRDGLDGALVPNENVAALADAMDRLMSDESERRRLGSRAREVVERFSIEEFFRRWEAVLREER